MSVNLIAWQRKLELWWCPPSSPQALAALRVVIGTFAWIYLICQAPSFWLSLNYSASQYSPIGVVSITHEHRPAAMMVAGLYALCFVLGPLFTLGIRYRCLAPIFAGTYLWLFSYRSSWGMIFHTDNLLVIHLAILAIAPAADSCTWRGSKCSMRSNDPSAWYGWPIKLISTTTVLTYFLAGWAKIDRLGLSWLQGDELRQQIAYDNLRKIMLGDIYSPLGVAMLQWSWVFQPLAWLTLLVELGAPLVLFYSRIVRVWVIGVWLFHAGVLATMVILFPYPLIGGAFLSFFPIEKYFEKTRFVRFFRK